MSHLYHTEYEVPTLDIGAIEPQVIVDLIDKTIKEIYYRNFLSNEEIADILTAIGAKWSPTGARGLTNTVVTNMLLDARLSLMTEGESDVELSKELDALTGADIDSG